MPDGHRETATPAGERLRELLDEYSCAHPDGPLVVPLDIGGRVHADVAAVLRRLGSPPA
jgi:hypothetical protein